MSWVFLEGVDRTGKTTVSEFYKKKGFEIVHMSAPSKKFNEPGYSGPSYADECLEIYMSYDHKDVVFDRTIYGEAVWPYVYNRKPALSDEDVEMLQEFEERNQVERILMIDPDTAAHWKRCVDNKEPMNQNQFRLATSLFAKMAHKYSFQPRELKDYVNLQAEATKPDSTPVKQEAPVPVRESKVPDVVPTVGVRGASSEETELEKLDKANAIKDVLSKRLIKQKGGPFDKLEEDIQTFLKNQLSSIFSEKPTKVSFNEDEILILKMYCQQLKDKVSKKQ